MIALVIPIFNRVNYLTQCFDSLKKLTTKPDVIILYDDCSTDPQVQHLMDGMKESLSCKVIILHGQTNSGVRAVLKEAIDCAFGIGAETVINLDSDMIVRPTFIPEIMALKVRHPQHIISGINCTMRQKNGEERNPLISEHDTYYLKKYVAGQCLCYYQEQYQRFIRPALLINGNWDHNASIACDKEGLAMVVCKPSVAQHIGMESSMGHNAYGEAPDQAMDFDNRICLRNVTLFGIDAANPVGIMRAAAISSQGIIFAAEKIITQRLFPGNTLHEGRVNYSRFMIKELTNHFDTSHVLTIHSDGYVVNPKAWKDEWLQYDFIGASWLYKDGMNCGNGGFSLRSKKLCEVLAKDNHISEYFPEDHHICRTYRPYLENKYGIKFAPEEAANRFSIEAYGAAAFAGANVYSGQFGFHGNHFTGNPIPYK